MVDGGGGEGEFRVGDADFSVDGPVTPGWGEAGFPGISLSASESSSDDDNDDDEGSSSPLGTLGSGFFCAHALVCRMDVTESSEEESSDEDDSDEEDAMRRFRFLFLFLVIGRAPAPAARGAIVERGWTKVLISQRTYRSYTSEIDPRTHFRRSMY